MTPPRFAAACAALFAAVVSFAALAQDAPFIGVVTDSKIEVRSGAGRAYYVVGELKKGDMVRVEKVLFNQTWYQVRVPSDIHSYVSKAFVDAQGDGESGKINADRTEFKAASLRGPGESYRVQGMLNKGDSVKIISEEGNFYKIESPAEAFVFIPAGNTLRKATAADLEAAGEDSGEDSGNDSGNETPSDPDTRGEDQTPDQVTPVPPVPQDPEPEPTTPDPEPVTPDPEPVTPVTPDPEPVTPVTPDPEPATPPTLPSEEDGWPKAPDVEVSTPARSDLLKTLEAKVLPYFSLPVTEQPLDKMAKAYQDLSKTEGLPSIDQQIISVRLRQIKGKQRALDVIERAEQTEKTDYARTVVPEAKDDKPLPNRYTVVGVLQPSTVYDGSSLPLLYRVVDASPSARTLAYVAPSDKANLGALMDQLVGIVGQTTYNRTLKLQVIEIERAVPLEADDSTDASEQAAEESAEEASEETGDTE